MPQPAAPVYRAQKQRVDALQHQRAVDQRQRQHRHRAHAQHQNQRRRIHRQHRTEQEVQQIHIAAVAAHQHHAQGQAGQVKRGKIRVFLQIGVAAHQTGKQRHRQPGGKTAQAHGRQAERTGGNIARRRAGQHRMAKRVAHQAHTPHHQKHAHRRRAHGQKQHGGKGIAHKIVGKGFDQELGEGHGVCLFVVNGLGFIVQFRGNSCFQVACMAGGLSLRVITPSPTAVPPSIIQNSVPGRRAE